MLHVIDTVIALPEMTSHVMKELSESYQHRDNIEMLLKQRERYLKQEETQKHNNREKDGTDDKNEQGMYVQVFHGCPLIHISCSSCHLVLV